MDRKAKLAAKPAFLASLVVIFVDMHCPSLGIYILYDNKCVL